MKTSKYSLLVVLIGLSSSVPAAEQAETFDEDYIRYRFIRESKTYPAYDRALTAREKRLSYAGAIQHVLEKLRRETPALSPEEMDYLETEVKEIGQIKSRERQAIRYNALWAKGLHHRQKIRSLCDDALSLIALINREGIDLQLEMQCWISLYSELNNPDVVTGAAEFMVAEGYWDDQSAVGSFTLSLHTYAYAVFHFMISPAASLIESPDDSEPYLPQEGDVGLEMKGFDGEWSEVVLVHGYPNNHGPAEMIKKMADDTSGRPEGSFRLKEH